MAIAVPSSDPPYRPREEQYLYERKGWGDKTVPFVSAFRQPGLLAPGALTTVVQADGTYRLFTERDYRDSHCEHTGLTQNPRVHRGLLYFLRTGQRLWTDGVPAPRLARSALAASSTAGDRELLVVGTPYVQVRTPTGETSQWTSDGLVLAPEGVDYSVARNLAQLQYPPDGEFEFTLQAEAVPLTLPLLELSNRDSEGAILRVARFLDVTLHPGAKARLIDKGAPPFRLEIDEGADGTNDVTLEATFVVEGALARDDRPPVLAVSRTCVEGQPLLVLQAEDAPAGLASVVYQTGETPAEAYRDALDPGALRDPVIRSFATDLAGNRSPLYEFEVLPRLRAERRDSQVRLVWERTCWPLVLEFAEVLGDASMWQPLPVPLRDEGALTIVEVFSQSESQFFRLRLSGQSLDGQ
jgi:hypothetical protein